MFAKGADVIPFDSFPNRVTPEIHRNILQAARDAHMNMVREWGGGYYESDDFYDICDELGIMVWQEFMFGGDMIPGESPFKKMSGKKPSTRSSACAIIRASLCGAEITKSKPAGGTGATARNSKHPSLPKPAIASGRIT